eukprot:828060-Rhodomonas_salina.4
MDCWYVGKPCQPNCSFPWIGSGDVPGLYGYYLTDDKCSAGPRASQHRELCGRTCPLLRLPLSECTPENRGCVTCDMGQYVDTVTLQCQACGSMCRVGYYAAPCAAPPTRPYTHTQLTEAQKGCFPCEAPAGTSDPVGSVWVSQVRLRPPPPPHTHTMARPRAKSAYFTSHEHKLACNAASPPRHPPQPRAPPTTQC